jgi:Na+-transporting NADH:ubiquinone oxidoreductase subunit F
VIAIIVSMTLFTIVMVALSLLVLAAQARLLPSGEVDVVVNEDRTLQVPVGGKLMGALADAGLVLPSACGGKGTCGQCRVQVLHGAGPPLPTEAGVLSRREAREHVRLACQVAVREKLDVRVPEEVFGVRKWECRVRSNDNVSTFIKELVLELPADEVMEFSAGSYVLIECPPFRARYADFDVPERFRSEWNDQQMWRHEAHTDSTTSRAYSMANYAGEAGRILLNVRIAPPPPGHPELPPGVVSGYIFSLKPGHRVTVSGPFGSFYARDTQAEMVFVGGGAGMAPMRSLIFDQLKRLHTKRKMSYWYGARSRQELFYVEDFDRLAAEHETFEWHAALSEPRPEDAWQGYTGFIHRVLHDRYLAQHPAPEDCEYYLCGPPLMTSAVTHMLEDLGVERESIYFDDFGG